MTRARDLAAFVSNADGDIKFDTDTLFIDSSENRVGIGNTAPDTMIHGLNATAPVLKLERDSTSLANNNIIGEVRMSHKDSNDAGDAVRIIGRAEGTAGAAGLAFTTGTPSGGAERMRIDSDGNIGIGVNASSPDTLLHLSSASGSTGAVARLESTDTSVGSGQQVGAIEFEANDASTGGSGISGSIKNISTNATGTSYGLTFNTGNASGGSLVLGERARIDFDGLKFNGDTAAANGLDDFETGTWTPTAVQGLTGFSNNRATYTKIGRLVYVQAYLSALTGKDGNQIKIGGLPFTTGSQVYSGGFLDTASTGDIGFIRTNSASSTLSAFSWDATTVHRDNMSGNEAGVQLIFSLSYEVS